MRLIGALFVAAMLLLPERAVAAAERTIFQYTHQRWSDESSAPRPVVAVAQGRRGFLWLATAQGVYRFDGLRFERIGAGVDLVRHGAPSALLVRRNGDVWVNFERSGRFAVYRAGRLDFLRAPPSPDRVTTMHETADGTIWVLTERIGLPLLRFRKGKWTSFGTAAGAPPQNPFSMVVTRDGVAWISFSGSVARVTPDGRRFEFVRREPSFLGRLSIDPDERIWVTERAGSYPITGPGGRGRPPPLRHAYATDAAEIRGWPAFDREGNLWIATYYDGLQRVARPDPRGAASPREAVSRVERFTTRDGLTSSVTSAVFQDSEGNVWVATANGLDRFWPASVRFEPQLTRPAAFGDLLLAASDGSVYIGQASTVYRVRPRGRPEPIFTSRYEPRTLCEAPDGAIWIGTMEKAVAVWQGGAVRRRLPKAPLAYTTYDCAFDAAGDYWITTSFGGMARFKDGAWQRMFGATSPSFVPKAMLADARRRLVIQWNDRTVSRLAGRQRQSVPIPWGDHEPDDVALHAAPGDSVLIAGRFGLARWRGGAVHSLPARRHPLLSGVSGMAETPDGDSWLASPGGILRLRTAELERAFSRPEAPLAIELFAEADGLKSRPHSHSRNAVVRGGDGRLWIATQTGTVWLDPADLARSRTPPPVAISALAADRVYRDPVRVTLPAGTSDIQIDFAVPSFSSPRGARVKYRLEGQDARWVEAGMRRQAFFTNLAPGRYRFQLIAANDDGVRNRQGAAVEFVIPPTFVQSWAFIALCAALALILFWLVYHLHMAQVAGRIRTRLEERLSERERIARELHDTLLQGVQGLVLRFQSVANKMPAEGPLRPHLEAALKRADDIIAEGRDRVQDLRAASGSVDLPELLRERAVEAGFDPPIPIRIVVEGRTRSVHALIAVELGRIVGEALVNVARHAKASSVEIGIRFTDRELAVEVRDDGSGIDAAVLATGQRPGHFGLVGMRERAERIGASLLIDSGPRLGCVVTMTLPARLAFADPVARPFARFFARPKEASHV